MLKYYLIIVLSILTLFSACRQDDLLEVNKAEEDELVDRSDYSDWTDATHGNLVDQDYSVVFNQDKVLRFDIEISKEDWSSMQSDLSEILGSSGGRPGPGGGVSVTTNPMWVKCSLKFNDREWYNVGIRYKGNSSLKSTYRTGNKKFSFKLDFDEFEEDYPALENQRFYGFKQLNLNNNFEDASLMREKIGADLFRQFGVVAAKTTFCVLYINNGNGSQYYGVYTLVEEVDDSVIKTQFSNGTGNLYKPEGSAATFAHGTFSISELQLKTNEDSANYTDVRNLYEYINSSERVSNPQAWKTNLEEVLNVDGFLKWLAANTVIQNWDTYGRMTHNYYLYNNPENNLLTWIPWDNNEAFQTGKQGGALSLSLSEVGGDWPLINYITGQSEYKAIYESYLHQFIDHVFMPSEMINIYSSFYEMLKDYAYAEEPGYTFIGNNSNFDQAVATLKSHVQSRNNAVNIYLN